MRKVYLVLIILLSFIIIRLYADEPAFIPERNFLFKTTALTVQDGFSAPCVYDWNKDGRKDLIVGSGSGKIFVYINVGNNNNPEFDTCFPILYKGAPLIIPCTYTTLFGYISDTSDLNGDDLNDLIVGVNNILYFYENTGTASSPQFNTERTQIKLFNSSGFLPSDVKDDVGAFEYLTGAQGVLGAYPIVGDFNSNGVKDILSAYTYLDSSGRVHHCAVVYTNMGTTTQWDFKGSLPFGPFNHIKISAIDITNGNAATSEFLNTLIWYLYPFDWDNDGTMDLVGCYNTDAGDNRLGIGKDIGAEKVKLVWYKGGSPLMVFLNITNKGEIKTDKNKSINLPSVTTLCVADWDGDSNPDVLCGSHLGFITLFERTSSDPNKVTVADNYTRNIQVKSENNLFGWIGVSTRALDWNNDGKYDIIFGNLTARSFYALNEGDNQTPVFRDIRPITIGTGVNERIPVRNTYAYPDFYDWNNDGKGDLIISGGQSIDFIVFTNIDSDNNGIPIFSTNANQIKAAGEPLISPNGYVLATPTDWDCDGYTDLIVVGEDGVFLKYHSNGSNNLQDLDKGEALRYENGDILSLGYMSSKPYILDWDGDGDDDMISASQSKVFIFINEGNNENKKFYCKKELKYGNETFAPGSSLIVIDYNKDGYYDIILDQNFGLYIYYGGPARFVGEKETLMPEDRVILFPNPVKKLFINRDFSERYYINEAPDINDTANIGFAVRDDAVIEIYIYTLSGKLIEKIYGDAKYSYKNIALFNFKGLANGVYIVRIKAISKLNQEEDVVTKKISILK